MKRGKTELGSSDRRYGDFCEAFRRSVLEQRIPNQIADKTLEAILEGDKERACPSTRRGGNRFTALAAAACIVLMLCVVPFLPLSADAQVVTVNKTPKILQKDIEYIGYAKGDGGLIAQFEVDLRWDGNDVSAVTYRSCASAVAIRLIDETFSQDSWLNSDAGMDPVARYSYKEGASLYARCLLSVAVGLSDEVSDKEIETLGREALSGATIEAAAELENKTTEFACSKIE